MDLGLQGKVALVTGGSRGLGEAICLGLAAEGAKVAVNYYRNESAGVDLVDEAEGVVKAIKDTYGTEALAVPGDVTIWNNYMTLHNSPPIKSNVSSIDDARLLYRLSCKGEPALSLPRSDEPAWLATHIAGGYSTPQEIIEVHAAS